MRKGCVCVTRNRLCLWIFKKGAAPHFDQDGLDPKGWVGFVDKIGVVANEGHGSYHPAGGAFWDEGNRLDWEWFIGDLGAACRKAKGAPPAIQHNAEC